MIKSYCILLIMFLMSYIAYSQEIKGRVLDITGKPIQNVQVTWKNSNNFIFTNLEGEFSITKDNEFPTKLVFSHLGYMSDTLSIGNGDWKIQLMDDTDLNSIEVSAKSSASRFINDVAKVEALGVREIQRAACCSLAGCFSTNSNVDANTTNVITDAKELRILGLAGVYNQVLIEGLPLVQGLSFPYGPGSYPSTMIEKIFITKGANSVLQGFESISGQINLDFHNASTAPKYFFNAFANSFGETQYNANQILRGKSSNNLTTFHLTTPATNVDRDGDGFRDVVKVKRYSIFNRWTYDNADKPGIRSNIGFRYLNENREGGLTNYDSKIMKGSNVIYGQNVNINHGEAYTRTNFTLNDKSSIILLSSAFLQKQETFYGVKKYVGNQFNLTSSLYYDYYYGNANHNLKVGLSHRHNRLKEKVNFLKPIGSLNYNFIENTDYDIPGIFVENKYTRGKFTILSGLRLDKDGEFGWKITPRLLVRAQFNESNDVRFSIGKGFRRTSVLSENPNLLASNRSLNINSNLSPEEAVNTGINYIKSMYLNNIVVTLSADAYLTYFQNQVFPDYDKVTNKAFVDNFLGKSVSNSFQIENKWEFSSQFDAKISYNYLDVYRVNEGVKNELPFVSKHKFIANTSYSTKNDHWQFDLTYRYNGSKNLPSTKGYPDKLRVASKSPAYHLADLQITRRWTKYQIYGGIENIFNFRQNFPILGYDNPFGTYFDPSFNWGPVKGRELFLGFRYSIDQKEEK
jgi:outer membrane receptor for ferrienterochelin and colicins